MERVKEGELIWWMYFVYVYENRTMKPVEIVLRGRRGMREYDGGVNIIKIHCKLICNYHNKIPLYN
jgi:hypothetical protein